jgi:hypothetical protein
MSGSVQPASSIFFDRVREDREPNRVERSRRERALLVGGLRERLHVGREPTLLNGHRAGQVPNDLADQLTLRNLFRGHRFVRLICRSTVSDRPLNVQRGHVDVPPLGEVNGSGDREDDG